MNPRIPRALPVAVAAAIAVLAVSACDRDTMDRADQDGKRMADKANAALATTKDKLAQAGHEAKEKLETAGQRTADAISNAGEKTSEDSHASSSTSAPSTANGSTGGNARSVLADAGIKASIETDFLKDPDLSVLKIDVDSKDGVITLNGLTKDETARSRAAQIAQKVKGVREVRNFLVVKRT